MHASGGYTYSLSPDRVVLKAGTERNRKWNGTGRAPRIKIVFKAFTSFPLVK